jgi:hypothetical protein
MGLPREDNQRQQPLLDLCAQRLLPGTVASAAGAVVAAEFAAVGIVAVAGPWIFGKKVMLPAGVIERVDRARRR